MAGHSQVDKYAYRVRWSAEDSAHVGLCAEFPSLSWLADGMAAALDGIARLVAEAVSDMTKSGEPIPEPFALRSYSGKLMVRVPPDLHRELAIEAGEQKVSLNRLISRKLAGTSTSQLRCVACSTELHET